ncbi:MAG: hypothetical protein ACJAVS_002784 [Paracoccaceae bacterium]|jgi:hypothetical protein
MKMNAFLAAPVVFAALGCLALLVSSPAFGF